MLVGKLALFLPYSYSNALNHNFWLRLLVHWCLLHSILNIVLYVFISVGTHCVHSWATSQSINLVLFLCLLPSDILTFGWRGTPLSSLLIWRWKFLEKRSPTTPLTFTLEKFMVRMAPFQHYLITHLHINACTSTYFLHCCHGNVA